MRAGWRSRKQYNYYRDYDSATGRYLEADPMGQRVYFDFTKFAGLTTHRGYWNHIYNYVDDDPVMGRDPKGLLPGWLESLIEFFHEKTPEEGGSYIVGKGISAICIARNCGKSRSDVELEGDCADYLSGWVNKHPEIMGAIGGLTSDGAAAAVTQCEELCSKGIKSSSCCKANQ
jgi:hypothetical protein